MPSIFTLDGLSDTPVDPYELPSAPRAAKAKKRKVISSTGSNPPSQPLPKNPRPGDCSCRWNPRKKRWVKLCFIGKGNGKGQTRSGWAIRSDSNNFCERPTR